MAGCKLLRRHFSVREKKTNPKKMDLNRGKLTLVRCQAALQEVKHRLPPPISRSTDPIMSVSARVPGPLGSDNNPGRIDDGTLALAEHRPPVPTCAASSPTVGCAVPAGSSKEKSGAQWVSKFPGSALINDLSADFSPKVQKFVDAIRAAGGQVVVNATYRPRERAYLMHYSSKIARGEIKADKVPAMAGVDIDWVHDTNDGSVKAAKAMARAYHVVYPPALISRHTERGAIDMTITGIIGKKMVGPDGKDVDIKTEADLHATGKKFGVIKLLDDEPHWSDNGH